MQWTSLLPPFPLDVAQRQDRRHGLTATLISDGSGR